MSKKYSFLISILIISIIKSNYIHLFFQKDIQKNPYDIENVFFTSMTTNISLGTPPKNITLQISTDTPFFMLQGDSLTNKKYSQDNSSSYYFVKYGHSYSYRNIYFHAIFFEENYILENNAVKLNSMMCWGKYPMTKSDGIIGLQLKDIKFDEKNIFLNQLQEKNIIKNKIFSLLYNDENSGELFIGDYPHNKTELLKNKKFKICKNNFFTNGAVWGTIFEQIDFYELIQNNKIQKKSNTKYRLNLDFKEKSNIIIFSNIYYGYLGSKEYNRFIYETFFKEKINTKNCWTQTIDDDKYFGYVCSKNTDLSLIAPIKFYHKGLNHTFVIENDEMWVSRNNIKYFLIFFSFNDQYSWTFGEKFLVKYNLVFDASNNYIGLYYSEDDAIFNYYRLSIFGLVVGFIIICLLVGYKCIKWNKNNEKKDEGIELNLIENNKM